MNLSHYSNELELFRSNFVQYGLFLGQKYYIPYMIDIS